MAKEGKKMKKKHRKRKKKVTKKMEAMRIERMTRKKVVLWRGASQSHQPHQRLQRHLRAKALKMPNGKLFIRARSANVCTCERDRIYVRGRACMLLRAREIARMPLHDYAQFDCKVKGEYMFYTT